MNLRKLLPLLLIAALSLPACDLRIVQEGAQPNPTPTEITFATATLAATNTPIPTATPSLTPTPEPVNGTAATQLNARSGPGTAETILGRIEPGTALNIIGKDASGAWLLIAYTEAGHTQAWVSAQFVTARQNDLARLVVVNSAGALATEVPTEAAPPGVSARALQKINVRSGPGVNFDSVGLLNANDPIIVTGINENGTWLQVAFPQGPGGRGWVTVAFVQIDSTDGLPILDELGNPIPQGGTPGGPAPTPTATLVPAALDNDTAQRPYVNLIFSPAGARLFTHASDVSIPSGDPEDWVGFIPSSAVSPVLLSLACQGNGRLLVILLVDGQNVTNWKGLECGDTDVPLTVEAGRQHLLWLRPVTGEGGLQYVNYTLSVRTNP